MHTYIHTYTHTHTQSTSPSQVPVVLRTVEAVLPLTLLLVSRCQREEILEFPKIHSNNSGITPLYEDLIYTVNCIANLQFGSFSPLKQKLFFEGRDFFCQSLVRTFDFY